ncbi:hypothetical protein CRUP_024018, partial [Coryphaenoides rupestris]
MLTDLVDGLICCLTGKSTNVVVPMETSEAADGYEFVEVKPGRVLRVRHVVPERPVVEEPPGPGGSLSCKRRITLYRNGQMLIENLGEQAAQAELSNGGQGGGGEAEPNISVELDLIDPAPAGASGAQSESGAAGNQRAVEEVGEGGGGTGAGEGGAQVDQTARGVSPDPQQQQEQQAPRPPHRRKPKRTVVVDCERRITSCKGTHADVALFFVHGVGGSLDIWGSQLDFFSRLGYEVIAPDLAGHGASSAPQIGAAYTFYALAEDMRVLFKRYARKRNVLIGHSYGVSFCTFLAHEYPEQVHKMVMINGGGPTALEPSLWSVFNLPTCGSKERQLLKEHNAFNVSSFVLRATMSGQYWPEGDEVYHAELSILLLAFLKVLDDGSHMIMMECPEAVNTLLHEFLLWEPTTTTTTTKKEPKSRPATAKAETGIDGPDSPEDDHIGATEQSGCGRQGLPPRQDPGLSG